MADPDPGSGWRILISDPDPGFYDLKLEIFIAGNLISIFLIKNCNYLASIKDGTPKLQEKPSALKKEHPVLKNIKILDFFLFLWVIFALLNPDPATQINADPCRSGYGSGSETYPSMGPNGGSMAMDSAVQKEEQLLATWMLYLSANGSSSMRSAPSSSQPL
jgi:hypothetical protein